MRIFSILAFLVTCNLLLGQNISGIVKNESNGNPVSFVNIGIAGKNFGTVSDLNGRFNLVIDSIFDNETLLFSSIGYYPFSIKVSDFKSSSDKTVRLKEKKYDLNEVIIKPKIFKSQTLGVTTKSNMMSAGFRDNFLGYEYGIIMKVKKSAFIKSVNFNIASCSYDSIYYRLNIYKVLGKMEFENILREPIYVIMPKQLVSNEIQIDLKSKNIVVEGDFLVTLEHIKDLGAGSLYFCAGFGDQTYFRKTSQGEWGKSVAGISISVVADVEK